MSHEDSTAVPPQRPSEEGGDAELRNFEAELERLRPELLRVARGRLDRALRGRLDPEDVVQQALVTIVRRREEWARDGRYPLRIWAQLLLTQTLDEFRRRHLGTASRDARKEAVPAGGQDSATIERDWTAQQTSVTALAARSELRSALEALLERLSEPDREILQLRFFREVSAEQAAAELAITPAAAAKRLQRAMERLRPLIEGFSGNAR
jgi:RNA polymerase sigma-70 factor, ECF subfamily